MDHAAQAAEALGTSILEKPKNASPRREMPGEDYHRGKPASSALYEMHTDLMKKQEVRKKQAEEEAGLKRNSTFKSKDTIVLMIDAFKKEFR